MQTINSQLMREMNEYISCSDNEWIKRIKPSSMQAINKLIKYTEMDLHELEFPESFVEFVCAAGASDGGLMSNVLNGEFNVDKLILINQDIYENWKSDINPMEFEFLSDEVGISYLINFKDSARIWYGDECVESSSFENFLMQCAVRQYEKEKYAHHLNIVFRDNEQILDDPKAVDKFQSKIIEKYGLIIQKYSDDFFCYAKSSRMSMYIKKRTMSYGMRNIGNVFLDDNGILSDILTEINKLSCCEVKLIK